MSRRLLVVATAPDPSDELLERLGRDGGDDVEVAIVAPASSLSPLQWVTGDDTRAREEAQRRALEAAEIEALAANVVDVRVGDPDPVIAVADALQTFPADELVVVTRPREAATWLERAVLDGELEQFGLPITHIVDDEAGSMHTSTGSAVRDRGGSVVWVIVVATVGTVIPIAAALGLYFGLR